MMRQWFKVIITKDDMRFRGIDKTWWKFENKDGVELADSLVNKEHALMWLGMRLEYGWMWKWIRLSVKADSIEV